MKVRDIHRTITIKPPIVFEEDSIERVVEVLLKDPRSRSVYIVNKKEELMGIIPTSIVLKTTHILKGKRTVAKEDAYDALKISKAKIAKDIMLPPIYVLEDEDIVDALEVMVAEKIEELPVVDEDKNVIGDLNCMEIIKNLWSK